ncbi:MAG: hypothetical protein IPP10_17330 [Candidatus Competibacteraceae bacterium]|nr:hypothetical protein [Candidatus Competibacteraceae bacterium]MBK7985119.1 hypothetical protein [Candidatus Competibacteraceae bacterium]MBK8895806.1 hypothetical protein [Candidatus Competibacteraceae bacterium]MBK8962899.1 hypothetical protein [Candidatus Competibacteraceae bacterium]MBK9953168.1 hypothetical protein [Candidatus Competibacteraceae bacterium]
MNSSFKAALAAVAEFVAFWLSVVALAVWIVRRSFRKWQEDQAIEGRTGASAAVRSELPQLGHELGDWAEWSGAQAFTGDRDPAFVRANLGDWR